MSSDPQFPIERDLQGIVVMGLANATNRELPERVKTAFYRLHVAALECELALGIATLIEDVRTKVVRRESV